MKWHRIAIALALAAALMTESTALAGRMGRVDPETLRTPIYSPEGDAFVRRNGDRFNNRPLYCNQTSAIVVAGDRPLIRFGGSVLNGTFMAALVRGQKAKWLHDWSDITSKYRPDRMEWTLKDAGFGATVLALDAVPPADGAGMAVLRGTFPLLAFYGPVPGDLGHPAGGTDFSDCASTFCRTVVEGMFGYRPDYPNGVVTIAPQLPSDWDLARQFNGDIRTIFQQKYLSPRPDTCSLRLATDGYSTWQMMLGATHKAPAIDLARVPELRDSASRLRTPQGVPFAWADGDRNIAFTSMWDNWPRQVTVPVSRKAEGLWLLVCGYTNPMQGRIVNAELRMKYADGVVEKLELVPPMNFWSLCPFGGVDYEYQRDGFSLPKVPPATVQLGANCRANLLNLRLRPGVVLESITLETFSQEVIIGLMGATLMNPKEAAR